MKRIRVAVIVASIVTGASTASAQQRPDFSGTWTLDPASAPVAGGGVLGNGPATIRQTPDALTIERSARDAELTLTYKLDGSESRNLLMSGGGQMADALSTATWEGRRLRILTKQEMNRQITESTQVWTVQADTLTIETTGTRGTQKQVYKK